ncbi:MAG: FliO/MopB family protein [Thermoleophilia bacterium]|nr:FliO/MopB family protein [Thermoleophilia bacterium]
MQLATPTIVMIGLVVVTWYLSKMAKKKLGLGAGTVSPSQLKVVGKRILEPKKSLYVVEIGDRYVLVGTSENGVSLIDHITAEEFDGMSQKADAKVATTKTALARRFGIATKASDLDTDAEATNDCSATDADTTDTPIDEPRFATVGESFSMLLGKARSARAAKATTAVTATDIDEN